MLEIYNEIIDSKTTRHNLVLLTVGPCTRSVNPAASVCSKLAVEKM